MTIERVGVVGCGQMGAGRVPHHKNGLGIAPVLADVIVDPSQSFRDIDEFMNEVGNLVRTRPQD